MRSKVIGLLLWVAVTAWTQETPPSEPPATPGAAAFTFFRPEGVPPTKPVTRPNGDSWRKTVDGWAQPGEQRVEDEQVPVFWIWKYHPIEVWRFLEVRGFSKEGDLMSIFDNGLGDMQVYLRMSDLPDNISWPFEAIDLKAGPDGIANTASFASGPAPGSIASLFGVDLTPTTEVDTGQTLLHGFAVRVEIIDNAGIVHATRLFHTNPAQINFFIPDEVMPGRAAALVLHDGEIVGSSRLIVNAVSPGLFSANGTGEGVGLIVAIREVRDDSRQQVDVFCFDREAGVWVGVPIDLDLGETYLRLYGTGFRHAKLVEASIRGESVPVLDFAPVSGFLGLDQVNIGPLSSSLANAGEVAVMITTDGIASNEVTFVVE